MDPGELPVRPVAPLRHLAADRGPGLHARPTYGRASARQGDGDRRVAGTRWRGRRVPPCAATIASTSDSPRPAPPARVRAASPRVKRSNARRREVGGEARSVVVHGEARGRAGDGDGAAGGGVLAGVGQQVGHHLVQPRRVAGDGERGVGQGQPPLVGRRRRTRASLTASSSSRDRSTGSRSSGRPESSRASRSRSSTRPGHPRRLGLDLVERGAGRLGPAAGQLGVAGDGRQRRTQLVGGVGDELAHLLLAAVALVEGGLDVVEHRVERRADLPDLGALVGEAVGHPLGQVDLAGGQRQLGDPVGGGGDLAQRRELTAYDERAGAARPRAPRGGWRAARAGPGRRWSRPPRRRAGRRRAAAVVPLGERPGSCRGRGGRRSRRAGRRPARPRGERAERSASSGRWTPAPARRPTSRERRRCRASDDRARPSRTAGPARSRRGRRRASRDRAAPRAAKAAPSVAATSSSSWSVEVARAWPAWWPCRSAAP